MFRATAFFRLLTEMGIVGDCPMLWLYFQCKVNKKKANHNRRHSPPYDKPVLCCGYISGVEVIKRKQITTADIRQLTTNLSDVVVIFLCKSARVAIWGWGGRTGRRGVADWRIFRMLLGRFVCSGRAGGRSTARPYVRRGAAAGGGCWDIKK